MKRSFSKSLSKWKSRELTPGHSPGSAGLHPLHYHSSTSSSQVGTGVQQESAVVYSDDDDTFLGFNYTQDFWATIEIVEGI